MFMIGSNVEQMTTDTAISCGIFNYKDHVNDVQVAEELTRGIATFHCAAVASTMTENESKQDQHQAETRLITQIMETTYKTDMHTQVQQNPFNVIPPNVTAYLVSSYHHTFTVKALISFKIEILFTTAYL